MATSWEPIEFDGERDSLAGRQIHCGDVFEMEGVGGRATYVRYEMSDGEGYLIGPPAGGVGARCIYSYKGCNRFRWPS